MVREHPFSSSSSRLFPAVGIAVSLHLLLFIGIEICLPLFSVNPEPKIPVEMTVMISNPSPPESETIVESRVIEEEVSGPVPTISEDEASKALPLNNTLSESTSKTPVTEIEDSVHLAESTDAEESAAEDISREKGVTDDTPDSPVRLTRSIRTRNPRENEGLMDSTLVSHAGSSGSSAHNISGEPPSPTFSDLAEGRALTVPPYPRTAERWGWEGIVKVIIKVDAAGRITDVELQSSSGHRILDEVVLSTIVEKWSFNPPGRSLSLVKEFVFQLSSH